MVENCHSLSSCKLTRYAQDQTNSQRLFARDERLFYNQYLSVKAK
ncbi:hypothetical protein BN135_542 [Cronobacter muytjensii 530]